MPEKDKVTDEQIKMEREEIANVVKELGEVLAGKNSDYGNSIFQPPLLCPDVPALRAIECRLSDKIGRYINLRKKECIAVKDHKFVPYNESAEDTIMDIAGYCVLELAYMRIVRRQQENYYPDKEDDNARRQNKPNR